MLDPTATDKQLTKLLKTLYKLKELAAEIGFVVEVDEQIAELEAELARRARRQIL